MLVELGERGFAGGEKVLRECWQTGKKIKSENKNGRECTPTRLRRNPEEKSSSLCVYCVFLRVRLKEGPCVSLLPELSH